MKGAGDRVLAAVARAWVRVLVKLMRANERQEEEKRDER